MPAKKAEGFEFPDPGTPVSLEKITSVFSNMKLCSVPNVITQSSKPRAQVLRSHERVAGYRTLSKVTACSEGEEDTTRLY